MVAFDFHTVLSIVGVAFIGGIIGLDRTAAGQFMVSQPIVAAPITGWILGDVTTGLVIGAVLELIWVLDAPIGTFVPADASIGAVSATAIAIIGSGGSALPDVMGFSILLTTGMVPLTMIIDVIARKQNAGLAEYALAAPGENISRKLALAHLSGLIVFFMKSFILYLIVLPAGLAALLLFARMPNQFHSAMALFVKILPLLGAALVARKLSIRTLDLFLLMGFVTATIFTQFIHVPALSASVLVILAGLLGVRLSE
jgi:PTS system mannose-specific IIC component